MFVGEEVHVSVPGKIEPVFVIVDVGVNVLVKVAEGVRVAVPVKVDEAVGVWVFVEFVDTMPIVRVDVVVFCIGARIDPVEDGSVIVEIILPVISNGVSTASEI